MPTFVIPNIETERLVLRPETRDDLPTWAELIFADPDVIQYLPKRDSTPLERAQRAFDLDQRNWAQHQLTGWIITDKTNGAFMGNVFFEREETNNFELGYQVAKAYWNKGVATEASRAIVRYAFEVRNLKRIIAMAIAENIGSCRVLDKIGFVFEKDAYYYNLDVRLYGLAPQQFQYGDGLYRVHPPKMSS